MHQLADILGVHETSTRRWGTGRREIPPNVSAWLETLGNAHVANPLPVGWEVGYMPITN
jgi:hypothetical protein